MPVIAMSQEVGTKGSEVAAGVAAALGLGSVSHDLAERVADKLHIKKSVLQRLREGKASLFERIAAPQGEIAAFTADEVLALAQKGNVLVRGWGSTLLLRPVGHIPCIRVCAPMEARIRSLMDRLDTDDEEFIRDEVERSDAAHAAAMKARFNVTWGDPLFYDLTLNTERVSIEGCVEAVVALTKRPEFQETTASAAKLANLAIAARVRAALYADPRTVDCHITLTSESGRLRLRGIVENDEARHACAEVARAVPGVDEIVNDLKNMARRR